jgi:hypothetical protein
MDEWRHRGIVKKLLEFPERPVSIGRSSSRLYFNSTSFFKISSLPRARNFNSGQQGLREIDGWATSTSEVRFGGGSTYGGFKLFFPELHEGPLLKITVEGKVSLPLSRLGVTGTAFRGALYEPLASPKPTPGSREGHRTLWRRFSTSARGDHRGAAPPSGGYKPPPRTPPRTRRLAPPPRSVSAGHRILRHITPPPPIEPPSCSTGIPACAPGRTPAGKTPRIRCAPAPGRSGAQPSHSGRGCRAKARRVRASGPPATNAGSPSWPDIPMSGSCHRRCRSPTPLSPVLRTRPKRRLQTSDTNRRQRRRGPVAGASPQATTGSCGHPDPHDAGGVVATRCAAIPAAPVRSRTPSAGDCLPHREAFTHSDARLMPQAIHRRRSPTPETAPPDATRAPPRAGGRPGCSEGGSAFRGVRSNRGRSRNPP